MGFVEKALEALGVTPATTMPADVLQRIENRAHAIR